MIKSLSKMKIPLSMFLSTTKNGASTTGKPIIHAFIQTEAAASRFGVLVQANVGDRGIDMAIDCRGSKSLLALQQRCLQAQKTGFGIHTQHNMAKDPTTATTTCSGACFYHASGPRLPHQLSYLDPSNPDEPTSSCTKNQHTHKYCLSV